MGADRDRGGSEKVEGLVRPECTAYMYETVKINKLIIIRKAPSVDSKSGNFF